MLWIWNHKNIPSEKKYTITLYNILRKVFKHPTCIKKSSHCHCSWCLIQICWPTIVCVDSDRQYSICWISRFLKIDTKGIKLSPCGLRSYCCFTWAWSSGTAGAGSSSTAWAFSTAWCASCISYCWRCLRLWRASCIGCTLWLCYYWCWFLCTNKWLGNSCWTWSWYWPGCCSSFTELCLSCSTCISLK